MDLGISGLVSGFDWRSLIDQLMQVERAPEQRERSNQDRLKQRNTAYSGIQTQLETLKTRIDALKDPVLFNSRLATPSDATAASANTLRASTVIYILLWTFGCLEPHGLTRRMPPWKRIFHLNRSLAVGLF